MIAVSAVGQDTSPQWLCSSIASHAKPIRHDLNVAAFRTGRSGRLCSVVFSFQGPPVIGATTVRSALAISLHDGVWPLCMARAVRTAHFLNRFVSAAHKSVLISESHVMHT